MMNVIKYKNSTALYLTLFFFISLSSLIFTTSCTDQSENKANLTTDFDASSKRKTLRVLIPQTESTSYLPRQGYPLDIELEQLELFAKAHELKIKHIYTPNFNKLIDNLTDGRGDIIAANLTVTNKRKQLIDYSLPIDHVRQQLLQRAEEKNLTDAKQLKNKSIAIKASSSFWKTAIDLQSSYPSIKVIALDDSLDIDQILDKLKNKEFDYTIQDTNLVRSLINYRNDVKASLIVSKEQAIAWGIRQNNPALKQKLNAFIQQQKLNQDDHKTHTTDWQDIKNRKAIRMITRNNAANYFLYKGELLGFEYELAKNFAKKHKLRLEVIIPPDNEDMFDWLAAGKGDFIAASLSPTKQRLEKPIKFSHFYLKSEHRLVQRKIDKTITTLEQLNGKSIAIRESSAYYQTIRNLRDIGIKIKLEIVNEDMETEDIINRVAIGQYDLTIADKHILDLELLWRDDIQSSIALSETNDVAWVVRDYNPELLAKINQFHKKNYKSLFYNITYQKYFINPAHEQPNKLAQSKLPQQLSPYDDLVKHYADQYGFDWRMIVAQMYQESRFDPNAKSWVGALGLLQVMPSTAEELGFKKITEPKIGLHAGIKYLQWVHNRFDEELPVKDRMWFTLAAYNAGVGHVRDAIHLAKEMGWNEKRWFNNVERAMLLLRLKKYYRKSRFGFVRGREPVNYVRKIKNYYEAYRKISDHQTASID